MPGWLARRVLLPLIFLGYFGTLIFAAWHFPEPYDWRYRVISNLLSPRDNPQFYRVPSFGIALAGLLMIPLASYFFARLEPLAPRWGQVGRWSFRVGCLLLVLAAVVVPQHVHLVLGMKHLHEALARLSALGLAVGMICAAACARAGGEKLDWRLLPAWAALTLVPLGTIAVSELLLLLAQVVPAWGAPIREVMRGSVFWHLGFWEWTGSAAVFVFLASAVYLLPLENSATTER